MSFKKLLIIVLTVFILNTESLAQSTKLNNIGYAPFNITANKFNCKGFKEAIKPLSELHISFLYNTFGNNFSCIQSIMSDTRLKTLQIHLINEPGHRNKRLASYEFLYAIKTPKEYDRLVGSQNQNLKLRFQKYVVPIQELVKNHLRADTELLISPGLESNLSDVSGKILIQWTRELFPNARIVWNPLIANPVRRINTNSDLIEGHGLYPNINAPCVYNLDGTDISYPSRPALDESRYVEPAIKNWIQSGVPVFQLYENMANKCEVAFFWVAESNGLDYKNANFVDPRKRNNFINTSVYKRIFRDIIILSKRGQVYPIEYNYDTEDNAITPSCTVIRENFEDSRKRGNLLKQSEFRNRGGVLILSREFNSVKEAKLYQGKTLIDTYKKVENYKDGRNMYRSNKSPTTYPIKTYLMIFKGKSKICYKIPNPRIRLD